MNQDQDKVLRKKASFNTEFDENRKLQYQQMKAKNTKVAIVIVFAIVMVVVTVVMIGIYIEPKVLASPFKLIQNLASPSKETLYNQGMITSIFPESTSLEKLHTKIHTDVDLFLESRKGSPTPMLSFSQYESLYGFSLFKKKATTVNTTTTTESRVLPLLVHGQENSVNLAQFPEIEKIVKNSPNIVSCYFTITKAGDGFFKSSHPGVIRYEFLVFTEPMGSPIQIVGQGIRGPNNSSLFELSVGKGYMFNPQTTNPTASKGGWRGSILFELVKPFQSKLISKMNTKLLKLASNSQRTKQVIKKSQI